MDIAIAFLTFVIGVFIGYWLADPVIPYRGIKPLDEPPGYQWTYSRRTTKKTKRK